jgi:regulator of sigma E protease
VSWALAAFGFILLIVLHELGHMVAAKAVGMRVERFSLFFPPLVARRKRGETEYALGLTPLGGYVKITGMSPHEDIPPEVAHRAYYRQKVWKRIVVILAGPLVNIVLAFLILVGLFMANGWREATDRVDAVERGWPAAQHLRSGDKILAVDGKSINEVNPTFQISRHRCAGQQVDGCRATEPARVTVLRDGRRQTFTITPRYDAEAARTRLGFAFAQIRHDAGPVRAADMSLDEMWFFTKGTVETIARIFDPEARKQLSGPVGSYEVARRTFEIDTVRALRVIALISLSLGVVNLFPFLPLDGGHVFWAVAEKIRRRPIPFAVMERAGIVGFALVLMLFVIGLTNDIDRLTGGGFNVR